MKLQRLTLKNFKGHEHFTLEANGKCISVFGDNGSGKTTIADAYCLLLCGTDSKNTKSWSPKPNHRDGSEAHGLATEVEGVFSDPDITLKLLFKETYTKDKKLSGHKTDYYIDGGKCATKKEYEDRLKDLIPADAWYILDPMAFAFRAEWKKRRDVLMKLAGNIDVPMSDDMARIAGRHEVSVVKNIASTKKAELVKQRAAITPAVEELQRQVVDPNVKTALLSRIADAEYHVKVCEKAATVTATEEQVNLQIALNAAQAEMGEVLDAITVQMQEYRSAKNAIDARLTSASREKDRLVQRKESLEQSLFELKKELYEIRNSTPGVCSKCNQPIPAENHEEQKKKAEANNVVAGKKARAELISVQEMISKIDGDISIIEGELTGLKQPEIIQPTELNDEIATIKIKLAELQSRDDHQAKIDNLKDAREKHSALREEMARLENSDDVQTRINALRSQEKALSDAIAEQDSILETCNKHVAKLVTETARKVNGLFTNVTWKMFSECINGEPQECCEALVNGQPFYRYSSGGETINAGMDIIRVLRGYYNADLPIFVDNAESVTRLFNIPSTQIIRLVADATAAKITVKEN
jgi:DNA repair exonuclease SbcCD ATPase subunit